MRKFLFCLMLLSCGGIFAQAPPQYFQLRLPDFSPNLFTARESLIEVPDRPIEQLEILILDARQRDIMPGRYHVWINGKGIGNVLDELAITQGVLLRMSSETLRMRPDDLFDPWENTVEIVAQDRRGRQYYQNWIIRRRGAGQNPYFTYTSEVSPTDEEGIPPDVLLVSPDTPPLLASGREATLVQVRGTVSAASPGTQLSIDGKVMIEATGDAIQEFAFEVPVTMENPDLTLEAIDRKGNRRRVVIPIVAQDHVRPAFRFPGEKYALIVGISSYGSQPSSPPDLPGAALDASQLASYLEQECGFPHRNIRLLLDEEASLAQIRTGFADFAAKAGTDDLLVVYMAAHALHNPQPGRSDRLYLAPYGTLLSEIDVTAMRFSDLEMSVSRSIRSNRTFLIFDVSYEMPEQWRLSNRSMVNKHLLNLFSEQEGRSVLVSGAADELSQKGPGGGQAIGLFNHWLIKGLAGAADLDENEVVTASELFHFVASKVSRSSEGSQNPQFRLASSTTEAPVGGLKISGLPDQPIPDP